MCVLEGSSSSSSSGGGLGSVGPVRVRDCVYQVYGQSPECTHLSYCNRPFVHHQTSPRARPLFAIFAGLAMMLSPKVGELAFEVGLSTQALAQPALCDGWRPMLKLEHRKMAPQAKFSKFYVAPR